MPIKAAERRKSSLRRQGKYHRFEGEQTTANRFSDWYYSQKEVHGIACIYMYEKIHWWKGSRKAFSWFFCWRTQRPSHISEISMFYPKLIRIDWFSSRERASKGPLTGFISSPTACICSACRVEMKGFICMLMPGASGKTERMQVEWGVEKFTTASIYI